MDVAIETRVSIESLNVSMLPISFPVVHRDLRTGDHAAFIYRDTAEKYSYMAKYFNLGVERGDMMIYYAAEQSGDDSLHLLKSYGVEVEKLLSAGILEVKDGAGSFCPNGVFNVETALAEQRKTVMDALSKGYNAARIASDMSWALGRIKGIEALMEYEARFNYFARALDSVTLCNFNRDLFPKEVLFNAMQTHPVVIKKGMDGENPYYLDPSAFLGSESAQITRHTLLRLASDYREKRTVARVREEFKATLGEYRLSEREQRVVELILLFRSNNQISAELGISENTVKQHIKHVYKKMGVKQRIDLVARFMKLLENE